MSQPIHYCEAVASRRQLVLADLERARIPVRVVESGTALPDDATIALVGVDDLQEALPTIRRMANSHPQRQVLVLWEGHDPAQLIEAVRAGARDILIAAHAVVEAVERAQRRHGASAPVLAPRARGRVLAVYSLKGGIGKSTLTANLAIAMHRASGLPTTAMDLSLPCGNLEMYLDVQPLRSIGELLGAGGDIEHAMIMQALAAHPSGIRVLAGPRAASVEAVTRGSCQPVLSALGADGGLTIVDLGSFIEYAHASVLEAADLVVVPVTPLISSLGTLVQAREVLAGFGVTGERVLPVLNHTGPDTAPLGADVVGRLMGGSPRHVLPWGGADVASSLNEGLPLMQHRPHSPLALAIEALATDCLTMMGVTNAQFATVPTARPPMLQWLLGLFAQKGPAHVHS